MREGKLHFFFSCPEAPEYLVFAQSSSALLNKGSLQGLECRVRTHRAVPGKNGKGQSWRRETEIQTKSSSN